MKIDNRMNNQTTIMEVALAAGVSLATVSRVTNHPEKVKKETREKIERIIKEKGYKPNLNAKSLASSKSTTVAVVVPELARSSIGGMVDGIAACAQKRNYLLRLFVHHAGDANEENEEEFWSTILSSVVDGILFVDDEINQEKIDLIKKSYAPVVLTSVECNDEEVPSVSINYFKAVYEITKEMISRGNKKIWIISTVRKYLVNDLKINGYKKAMEEAGLTPEVKYVPGNPELNSTIFKEMFEQDHPEVAIVVRDSIATSLVNAVVNSGLKVPDDVQVIGCQNARYSELSRPSLTCINTPIFDLGEAAMDLLMELIDANQSEEPVNIDVKKYVDYNIVWRESTK